MYSETSIKYVRGEISVQDYWAEKIQKIDSALRETCRGCPGLRNEVIECLTEVFWELDAFDRTDIFWDGTNRLATMYKLGTFVRKRYEESTHDLKYARALAYLNLLTGPKLLDAETLAVLKDNKKLNIKHIVHVAWNTSCYWSDYNVVSLCELAEQLSVTGDILQALSEMESLREEGVSEWVESVRKRLCKC